MYFQGWVVSELCSDSAFCLEGGLVPNMVVQKRHGIPPPRPLLLVVSVFIMMMM